MQVVGIPYLAVVLVSSLLFLQLCSAGISCACSMVLVLDHLAS